VEVNARGVAQSSDPEFLHQLRVGLRRLRTVQRAFGIPGTKRWLRKLKPALAAARDWDVFLINRALPREIVPAAQRKALKTARRIDWHDEKRRHALRIRIRRLRYACEFFAPFFARAMRCLNEG